MTRHQTLAFPFISPTSFYNVAVGTEKLTFRPEWAGKFKERDMGHTATPWHWVSNDTDEPWDGESYLSNVSLRTVAEFGENKTEEIDGKRYTTFRLPKFILYVEEIGGDTADDAAFILECVNSHASLVEDVERLRDALEGVLHAVCGETGFANAVRHDSGFEYPWPALDIAEGKARKALEKTNA